MKVLLISPLLAPQRKPVDINIGLAYIAAVILKAGHEVELLDIEGYRYTNEEVLEKIKNSNCDLIGIGTLITGYKYVKGLVNEIKKIKPNVPLIIGGSIATSIPEIIVSDMQIDYAVIGEGEKTIIEFIDTLKSNGDFSNVKGLAYKKDGKYFYTGDRELIPNLDDIPIPAWHLFPLKEVYLKNGGGGIFPKPFAAFFLSTRGCPFHCTYCYNPLQNQKIRSYSAARFMEEIRYLRYNYQIKGFYVADDLFIYNRKRVVEICNIMIKEKLNLKWYTTARVNLVDEELLRLMKKAGCLSLCFGVETGSLLILKNIKKQATVDQVEKAIALCKKVGIKPICSYMIGNVGETRETVFESVELMKRLRIRPTHFFFATPYPGTELYDYAKENGKIPNEIELFSMYGEQGEKILVNFTNMPNKELFELRAEAIKKAMDNYYKQNIFRYIFHLFFLIFIAIRNLFRKFVQIFPRFFNYLNKNGFKKTVNKIIGKKA